MFKEVMNGKVKMLDRDEMIRNAEVEEMKKELRDGAETLLKGLGEEMSVEKAEAILRIASLILKERIDKKALKDIL